MRTGLRAVTAVLCIATIVSVATAAVFGEPEHFLEFTEDTYKIQFISGNLTASVTRDLPRVDFQHSENLFAPMFEVAYQRLFLFNDTNHDGLFSRSEAVYTSFLDESYVDWKITAVEFANSDSVGESAQLRMSSLISLYKGLVNQTSNGPYIAEWANISFTFAISERTASYANSFGHYIVAGRTDLKIVMSLDMMKHVDAAGIALEIDLKAGGSVYLFLIREQASKSEGTVLTPVSARIDERERGPDFAHRLHQTRLPAQEIEFARDDGMVQAHYHFSSEPTKEGSGTGPFSLNSSYFTTGTSLALYQAYPLGLSSDNLVHEMSLGLVMEGFVGVRDWAMENLPILAIITGGLVALTATSVHIWRRKQRRAHENGDSMRQEMDGRQDTGPK